MSNSSLGVLATGASTNGSAAMYTGADEATEISQVIAYNADSSAHPFTVTIVRAGTSLGDASNVVLSATKQGGTPGAVSIPAASAWFLSDHLDPEIELLSGDKIEYTADGTHITWYVVGA
jgi:hypothetical protein